MIEKCIDVLSDEVLSTADAICFTSNGIVRDDGSLVMGAGVAKAFRDKFKGLGHAAGEKVDKNGNVCQVVGETVFNNRCVFIVAFPTKQHWKNNSIIALIRKSAVELMKLIDERGWKNVYLPKPGVMNGQLKWEDVKKEIEGILDDRVTISYIFSSKK
jgi:hypothetical protein